MKNKKAFTLIELVSVLVILAILALIVTPLVLNIIRKARTAADKRSIDAYGRSIELAIADYLLENGTFPTSIEELTVEYTGDRVECTNKGINEDGTIYLTDCTVNGREITGYAYGRYGAVAEYEAYTVGQEVRYNNVDYRVIKESGTNESTVTLLKAEPLTYEEVQTYSNGTGASTYNNNGYGGMQYHSSSNDYVTSDIKTVVDVWKEATAPSASEARLITYDELTNDLGCVNNTCTNSLYSWLYNTNYWYWTMSAGNDSTPDVWIVDGNGGLFNYYVSGNPNTAVRPVIVLSKLDLQNQ